MTDNDMRISYLPTDGLSYDPSDPRYWLQEMLAKEVTRAFEICHGCRMCFKYCDSFPTLFDFIDNKHDGQVHAISAAETDAVMDACFQCKLCEVQCPYTPRDGHQFQLDFPRLAHRYQAVRTKEQGTSLRNKVLGDPDRAAGMARVSLGVANLLNRFKPQRWIMEKLLGIHRDKLLPNFAQTTFEKWARAQGKLRTEPGAEVVLFQTCFVQHNEPEIGRDVLDVLERNRVDAACVPGLKCCGMPAWEHGDLDTLRKNAHYNLDLLMPHVEAGAKVLVVNPTCSMMMRREYAELLEGEDRERAKKLAAAVQDNSEYLWSIRDQERFNTNFKSTPGASVAYHTPCHLRAQAIGFKGRDLMRKIPGVTPRMVMECCGHNGTYAMRTEGFEASQRLGKRAFDGMKQAEAEVWSTECPLAAMQFEQHAGTKPMHPMSILARAYRDDGFKQRLQAPGEQKSERTAS